MASNFPTRAPVGLIGGGLLALLSLVPILAGWQAREREFYLDRQKYLLYP